MQNLLTKIADFINKYQAIKQKRYEKQIKFLRQQTYLWFLKKVYQPRKVTTANVDFPDFIYLSGSAISSNALHLTDIAISNAIKKGKKHIEKCFQECVKQLEK